MREIKFRFWTGTDMKYRFDGWGEHVCINEMFQECDGAFEYKVMQYTGLKDKNGKEIYEGDVIKSGNGEWCEICFGEFCYPDKDATDGEGSAIGFYFKSPLDTKNQREPFSTCYGKNRYEVLGNIHENPDLLK